MKLLIYTHFFAPSVGGVETFAMLLACGLSQQTSSKGLQVTLTTQTPAGSFQDESLPFPVVRQPSASRLRQLIREADVVHIDGPALAALFWARMLGKPVVVEHHVYQAICPNGLLIHQPERSVCPGHFQAKRYGKCVDCRATEMPRLRAYVDLLKGLVRSALVRRVAANVAITDHVRKRVDLPRTSRIYYGIPDLSQDNPAHTPAKSRLVFAFAGRFVAEKGIPVLLQAAHTLAQEHLDFEVRLIGDGPLRPKLESIIERNDLRDRARITGYLSGESLAREFADIDVVVMPSVWEETAGLSAIEQMMRGKLVIASDIGGLGEVVGDAGLRCAAGDPVSLANAMRSVIANPSLIRTIGEKARARALVLFRQERMVADHRQLYERLATQKA